MIYDEEMLQIETAPGIIDVYGNDITSFTMADAYTVNVKERLEGDIFATFNIEVV